MQYNFIGAVAKSTTSKAAYAEVAVVAEFPGWPLRQQTVNGAVEPA